MNPTSGAALRVGAWRVDPASFEISKEGKSVRVEARALGLLLCLAKREGEVVSIEELLDTVWAGVIVTPDSVYQAVASLRRTLGDDARQPAYIETVPRLGYRLVAAVSSWADQPVAPALVPAMPSAGKRAVAFDAGQGALPARPLPQGVRMLAWGAALCLALAALLLRGGWVGELNRLAGGGAPPKSVAVLPILDLTSQQMNEEVFADGMTEELIDKLSKIRGLKVPGPTSSFYFKDKQMTVADIARSLGVTYVIDGSVRKSDATLRVAVRLIRAKDGYVIWSETYDRPEADKLALQDDIATQVAKAMKSSLT